MRTYVSPIGYDTRRVTRPVVKTGLGPDDTVHLLRPKEESDTEQATQAVADLEQLLQEIEPGATCNVERISTETFETTVLQSCQFLATIDSAEETVLSLGGGPRDILLPLLVASLVTVDGIDRTLFVSDLDYQVQEWELPDLMSTVPDRTTDTFESIVEAGDWISLSSIAERTDQSKSTVIRHVNDLEYASVVESDSTGKTKRVRVAFAGKLHDLAQN